MVQAKVSKLPMPGGSWEKIQKIIRAYHATSDESPTVESIAQLAGIPRSVISMNNNFLRAIGLLQEERYRLTSLGEQIATGLSIESREMVSEALQQAISDNPALTQLMSMLRARGVMKIDSFRGQIMLLAGLNDKSPAVQYIRSLIDILEESQLIRVSDDTITLVFKGDNGRGAIEPETVSNVITAEKTEPIFHATALSRGTRTPIPLGPSRLAYIELPHDWSSRELPKLIKLLQISLGEDSEET
jgi:hypothetical protein